MGQEACQFCRFEGELRADLTLASRSLLAGGRISRCVEECVAFEAERGECLIALHLQRLVGINHSQHSLHHVQQGAALIVGAISFLELHTENGEHACLISRRKWLQEYFPAGTMHEHFIRAC